MTPPPSYSESQQLMCINMNLWQDNIIMIIHLLDLSENRPRPKPTMIIKILKKRIVRRHSKKFFLVTLSVKYQRPQVLSIDGLEKRARCRVHPNRRPSLHPQ